MSQARELLDRLQAQGIIFEVFGGKLRYFPASKVAPADVALLRLLKEDVIAWLAPRLTEPIPRAAVPPPQLTDEAADLFAWFRDNRDRLPRPPFQLSQAERVEGTKFYEALAVDIAQGATGPRYRTGALLSDLRKLREITIARKKEVAA